MKQSLLDPVIGISVYIIDVYTHGETDAESLDGHNARLCKNQTVLADNLVLAAVPLRNDAGVFAFRVRVEALERIHAPGEIGRCGLEVFEYRTDWIDVPMGQPAPSTPAPSGPAPQSTATHIHGDHPTPPPFLTTNGIIYHNQLGRVSMPFDPTPAPSEVLIELQDDDLIERAGDAHTDSDNSADRLEDTQRIEFHAYRFDRDDDAPRQTRKSRRTQVLSVREIHEIHWRGAE